MTTAPVHAHIKPPVPPDQLEYKRLKQGEFWRHIPAYAEVDEATFLDHLWQQRKSVKTAEELLQTIREVCSTEFYRDAEEGFRRAPMAVRVSPYAIALIDWNDPVDDPIRRQFIPLASTSLPDHPRLVLDSLHEQQDSPFPDWSIATSIKRSSCRSTSVRSTAGSARAATQSDRIRRTSIRSRSRKRPRSGKTPSTTSRSGPSSRTSSSPAVTSISFRRRTSSSSATRSSTFRTCAGCASPPKAPRSCR